MIKDPLTRQMALNIYRAYLFSEYQDIDDLIDKPEPISFDEWCELDENKFLCEEN